MHPNKLKETIIRVKKESLVLMAHLESRDQRYCVFVRSWISDHPYSFREVLDIQVTKDILVTQ